MHDATRRPPVVHCPGNQGNRSFAKIDAIDVRRLGPFAAVMPIARLIAASFAALPRFRLAEPRSSAAVDEPASDTSSDLKAALLRLSADERLPLVLHFYLDLPLDEVARTLGVSLSAAKSRIYRAARRLRADLTLEEVF